MADSVRFAVAVRAPTKEAVGEATIEWDCVTVRTPSIDAVSLIVAVAVGNEQLRLAASYRWHFGANNPTPVVISRYAQSSTKAAAPGGHDTSSISAYADALTLSMP